MAERVVVLAVPISTGDLDLSYTSYAHVMVDRVIIDHHKKLLRWNILYGNVVNGVFVQGKIQPQGLPLHGQVTNRSGTEYADLITSGGSNGVAWGFTMRDAIYDHMIANTMVGAGAKQTV